MGNFYRVTLRNLTIEVRFVQAKDKEDAISEAIAVVRGGLAEYEPNVVSLLRGYRQYQAEVEREEQ